MSDEPTNLGPDPMVIEPYNPAGAVVPTSDRPLSSAAQKVEDHMTTSPYASVDPRDNPFIAGFHEAWNHLRALLARM